MPRPTHRDYKTNHRRPLDVGRRREFGVGTLVGLVVASTRQASEKYDFYQMLPNFEVVVPEKEKDVKRDLPATAKIERPGVYVLQAGSYRNEADATRVAKQLSLQGI